MTEHGSVKRDTTLKAAFRDSVVFVTAWNKRVDALADSLGPGCITTPKAFDRLAIKSNAVAMTPFLWAARKMGIAAAFRVPSAAGEDQPQPPSPSAVPPVRQP